MAATTEIKTRPILFSGEMVKAILENRKTQTRRVVKLSNVLSPSQKRIGFEQCDDPALFRVSYLVKGVPRVTVPTRHPDDAGDCWEDCGGECLYCPHGKPGDRLWVRETWAPCLGGACEPGNPVLYRADDSELYDRLSWRPSIFMPRWASRITLEITDIRVERLQDISEADKVAEGGTPEVPFGTVWRRINTKPGVRWEDNPWVWAISFKRIQPA